MSAEAPARTPGDDAPGGPLLAHAAAGGVPAAGAGADTTASDSGQRKTAADAAALVHAAGLVQAEIVQTAVQQSETEQAKAMVALIFAITPSEAVGLLSLAVDQRGWSLAEVAHTVVDLSRQPRGGDLDMVRHRFTLLLFSHMPVDALVARANAHGLAEGPGAPRP